jgi:hypothetical protein
MIPYKWYLRLFRLRGRKKDGWIHTFDSVPEQVAAILLERFTPVWMRSIVGCNNAGVDSALNTKNTSAM